MHDGCNASFDNAKEVIDKIRVMGFANAMLPVAFHITCSSCGKEFEMTYFETSCPKCNNTHGVTPCHSHDPSAVASAGEDY